MVTGVQTCALPICIANKLFTPIPLLIVAALWYLAITSVLMVGQYYLERYFGRGFDVRTPATGRGGRSRQAAVNRAGTTPHDPLPEVEL